MDSEIEGRSGPRIGVALGGGCARGLAHIPFIEALDELGLRPARIAGTSIGSLIGAGWANGMSGAELREHAYSVLGSIQLIAGTVWNAHRPSFQGLLKNGLSIQVDPEGIVDAFLPDEFPQDYGALAVPFTAVAADLNTWEEVDFTEGPIRPAIAASLAIPSLFRPVSHEGRLLVDGGVIAPVPLEQAAHGMDLLIGIDVNGMPKPWTEQEPNALDVGFTASQIMTQSLVRAAMRLAPPDIYVQPPIDDFGTMEFWRVREIVKLVEAGKDGFKRAVGEKLERLATGVID